MFFHVLRIYTLPRNVRVMPSLSWPLQTQPQKFGYVLVMVTTPE